MIDISAVDSIDGVLIDSLLNTDPEIVQYVKEMNLDTQQKQLLKDILVRVISYDKETYDCHCPDYD